MRYVGTAEIAEELEMPRRYVTNRLVKRPDFPKPVISLTQKTRRWSRQEVIQWIKEHMQ